MKKRKSNFVYGRDYKRKHYFDYFSCIRAIDALLAMTDGGKSHIRDTWGMSHAMRPDAPEKLDELRNIRNWRNMPKGIERRIAEALPNDAMRLVALRIARMGIQVIRTRQIAGALGGAVKDDAPEYLAITAAPTAEEISAMAVIFAAIADGLTEDYFLTMGEKR